APYGVHCLSTSLQSKTPKELLNFLESCPLAETKRMPSRMGGRGRSSNFILLLSSILFLRLSVTFGPNRIISKLDSQPSDNWLNLFRHMMRRRAQQGGGGNNNNKCNDNIFIFPREDRALHGTISGNIDTDWWRGNGVQIPINISTVDLTYAGARHVNGTLGMIVNPSTQRLKPFDYTSCLHQKTSNIKDYNTICPLTKEGIGGVGGHKVLEKIKRGVMRSREFLKYQQEAIRQIHHTMISDSELTKTLPMGMKTLPTGMNNMKPRAKKSRILCIIYTAHLPPNYDNPNLRAQAETWGAQCDGFIAASNVTDHSAGSIYLQHKGPEAYSNMWQKVRSMWAYVHEHYREEFDYFHIGGDDTYIVVENLRAYIDGPKVIQLENSYHDEFTAPHWMPPRNGPKALATWIPHAKKPIVIAGGPGYTLNRAMVDSLMSLIQERMY
ncbi:hypothetical protein ACHAXA_005027, partial [Cyclostephanos tholiformis]